MNSEHYNGIIHRIEKYIYALSIFSFFCYLTFFLLINTAFRKYHGNYPDIGIYLIVIPLILFYFVYRIIQRLLTNNIAENILTCRHKELQKKQNKIVYASIIAMSALYLPLLIIFKGTNIGIYILCSVPLGMFMTIVMSYQLGIHYKTQKKIANGSLPELVLILLAIVIPYFTYPILGLKCAYGCSDIFIELKDTVANKNETELLLRNIFNHSVKAASVEGVDFVFEIIDNDVSDKREIIKISSKSFTGTGSENKARADHEYLLRNFISEVNENENLVKSLAVSSKFSIITKRKPEYSSDSSDFYLLLFFILLMYCPVILKSSSGSLFMHIESCS
ncbi:MAG TPA: hypothetical protein PLN69_05020 [bacterium]|nr:hypothetical protein [bacterium]